MDPDRASSQRLRDWQALQPDRLFDLTGQVALVTGAAGGVGQWLAAGVAAAGGRVVVTDRDERRLTGVVTELRGAGAECTAQIVDLAEPDACEKLVEAVEDRYGRLDILVNCAAINHRVPALEVDQATFQEIVSINLRVPFFLSQIAAAKMISRGSGSIIHVGSINSAQGLSGVSVYGATKAGLSQLTRVQAIEWAPHGVRVNCLAPGFLNTQLAAPLWQTSSSKDWILSRVPLRRPGLPRELVGLLLLLASGAGTFITGQTLYVDGGFLAGSAWEYCAGSSPTAE